MQLQIPSSVEPLFLAAGWQPLARPIEVEAGASAHARAEAIVAAFGGLRVGTTGPGRDMAKSDVRFHAGVGLDAEEIGNGWARRVGELAQFGDAHHAHSCLCVGWGGQFYAYTIPDGKLYDIGSTFGEAMECLLLGLSHGTAIPPDEGAAP